MSKLKLKRPNVFQVALEASLKEVGHKAFHTIHKVLSDGLPPSDDDGRAEWYLGHCTKELSAAEAEKVLSLALEIELQARAAIVNMFASPGFMERLLKDMVAVNARKNLRKSHKMSATDIIQKFFAADPENIKKSTRVAIRELVRGGELIAEVRNGDDGYVVVDPSSSQSKWHFVKKTSIASTYSAARKKAASNLIGDT